MNHFQIMRTFNFRIFVFCLFTCSSGLLIGQCANSPLLAKAYFESNCGDKKMQSLIGLDLPIYGRCGNLNFTSPLTPRDVISANHDFLKDQIKIYPNPAMDYINIEWPLGENASLIIFSTLGQVISTSQINAFSSGIIDINHLSPGYYIIKIVSSNNKIFTSKLIKN